MAQQSKSYKKFVATAATATLVASAIVPVASANVTTSAFTDVPASYNKAVEFVVANNIAQGLTATQFGINNQIKRGDVAIMIAAAANLNDEKAPAAGFSDVPKRGALAINSLKAAGVISGKTTTKFGFEDNVTRGEAALMLQKAFDLKAGTTKNSFSDVSDRYDAAVDALVANKVTSGINAKQFGTQNNIKRGDFAKFLYALEDKIVVPGVAVDTLTVANPTTLTVKLKDAKQGLTAADFSVVVDGKVVVPTAVSSNTNSDTYTLTIPTLDGKAGTVSVNKKEVAYNFAKAEVKSVSTLNASELKVNFSTPVTDSAELAENYELKINNKTVTEAQMANITLSEDGMSAWILLDQSAISFQNGDKYVIQTNDQIVAKSGGKLAKFVSPEMTFTETAAPSLLGVKKSGEKLVFTFDRPVDSVDSLTGTDVGLVKVDDVALSSKDLKPVSAMKNKADVLGVAGDYRYEVTIDATANETAKKVGSHEVVIFDVKDTAAQYKKVASVLAGTYTVTNAVTVPEVTSVEAVNANRFFLYTNTAVTIDDKTKLTVNKGTHEFPLDAAKFNGKISNENLTVTDAQAGFHKTKPGVWVVVSDDKDNNDENPLYRTGEATANLTVTLENFRSSDLIGKKSTTSVTLTKSATKPVVDTTLVANDNELLVTFTNNLVKPDGSAMTGFASKDFIVRDNEGIIVEGVTATVSGKTVSFKKPGKDFKDAPYTVEFVENVFKNAEDRVNVPTYLANTVKNDRFTVVVGKRADANFEYKEFKFDTTPTTGNTTVDAANNTITFKYDTKMADSARNASNYTLDGRALPTGTTVDFVGDRQTVRVVFPKGTFKTNTQYKLGVKTDVKTEGGSKIVGSLQTKAPAELIFNTTDNVKPELSSALYYVTTDNVQNTTTATQIELTFSEAVKVADAAKALNDFMVTVNGSEVKVGSVAGATIGTDANHKIVLTLQQQVNVNQAATVSIIPEDDQRGSDKEMGITDLAGNKAKEKATATATGYKYVVGGIVTPPVNDAAAVKAATDAVAKAEGSKTQADVDAAKLLVDALKASTEKTNLQNRLTAIKVEGETPVESVTVQSLVDAGAIKFKVNPVTQQNSLLLDSSKLTGVLAGKKDTELELTVGTQKFNFKENSFKAGQYDVANTDFSDAELKAGKISIKK